VSENRPIETPLGEWHDGLLAIQHQRQPRGVTWDEATPVHIFRQTASTQEVARRHNGRQFAVIADEQTAGRGRLGRAWVAPPGTAVLMSLHWPHLDRLSDGNLDMIAYRVAVAVAQTAERFLGDDRDRVRIKWPNDILVDGRKLAGILVERDDSAAIIGIGFNVWTDARHLADLPADLADRITSLNLLGHPTDRMQVAGELIVRCQDRLADPDEAGLLDAWRVRSPLGYDARFRSDGEDIAGTVIDLDPALGLIVRRDTGEIVHLPAATTTVVID